MLTSYKGAVNISIVNIVNAMQRNGVGHLIATISSSIEANKIGISSDLILVFGY